MFSANGSNPDIGTVRENTTKQKMVVMNEKSKKLKCGQQKDKHTKMFHECERKNDANANNDDQVVSIQEPLSMRQRQDQHSSTLKHLMTDL